MKLMAWTQVKTALVLGAGLFLAGGTATLVTLQIREARRVEAQRAHAGMTQMNLTGPPGTVVTGFYIQNDQRVVVSNAVPWSFVGTNVARFEFHKLNREETVSVALVYDGFGAHARMTAILDREFAWMQGRVENGFVTMRHPY